MSGHTGAIAYSVWDIQSRPYTHVHLMNADGTGDHEIAQGMCPTFSTDGRLLSYWSGWDKGRQLVIANADGSSPAGVKATDRRGLPVALGDSTAVLSPDFSLVAWSSPDFDEVWVTPVSGGPGVRVAPRSEIADERYSDLFWSPDGRRLAIIGMTSVVDASGSGGEYRSSIYVVDADGSNLRRLSDRPGSDFAGLSWSPDGRSLAFDGTSDGSPLPSLGNLYPSLDIFVIGADGTGERNLTKTQSATEREPGWSPDGSRLAYFGPLGDELPQGWPITVVRVADGVPVGQPVRGPETTDFLWSPDGARLLLVDQQRTAPGLQHPQDVDGQIRLVDVALEAAPTTVLAVHHMIDPCVGWRPHGPQP